jgi:hypothetical protein
VGHLTDTVGKLMLNESDICTVRQFNPVADYTIAKAGIVHMHRIMTHKDLFGF